MEHKIMKSWRHIVIILLDRGRKYGVFFSHELVPFLFISKDWDWEIGIITHFWNLKQMLFNMSKNNFGVQVPFKASSVLVLFL